MALPVGLRALFNFRGPKGDKGDKGATGTFASASAIALAAEQAATVEMSGSEYARHIQFGIPRGLPGLNAVPTDQAIATLLSAADTASRAAADQTIAAWAAKNSVYATDHGVKAVQSGLGANAGVIIQALMDAISAAGGGVLYLPPGRIRIDQRLIPRSNVAIVGAGKEATKLLCLESAFYGEHTEADPLVGFHLRGFTASGERFGDAVTWKGYHDQYHIRCSWVDVAFDHWGMTGLGPDYLKDCYMENCTTFNTGRANNGTQASGNGIGIATGGFGGGTENFTMVGCHVIQAKRFGIMIEGGPKNFGGKELASARVIGCSASLCGDAGFLLGGSRHSIYANNYAFDNTGDGILFGTGTIPQSTPSWRSIVIGNACHNNGGAGIAYDSTKHAVFGNGALIANNVCTQNAGGGIAIRLGLSDVDSVQVIGNFLEANTFAGLLLELGARVFMAGMISSNTFRNNWTTGSAGEEGQLVVRGGTISGSLIEGNLFRHNSASRPSMRIGTAAFPTTVVKTAVKTNHSPINPLITLPNATYAAGDLVIMGNEGANVGTAAVTVSASPFTYTAGTTPEYLYLRAGTITTVTKNGIALLASLGAYYLLPGQSVTITYTGTLVASTDRVQ